MEMVEVLEAHPLGVLERVDAAFADEPNADISDAVKQATAEMRAAMRDLIALFHAVNSHHVAGRNPYSFPALRRANAALTGNNMECGFDLNDATIMLVDTKGKETGL